MGSELEKKEKRPGAARVKVVDMAFRAGHIGTMSVLFGGAFWKVPFATMMLWHHLTIATGIVLAVIAIIKSRHWFYQGNGVLAEMHVALLAIVHWRKELMVPVLVAVLLIGVIGSHMPGKLRHWSLVHRRRID